MPNERRRRSDIVLPPASLQPTGPWAVATDQAIRNRAYQLYEARGGEPGAELDDWLRAERELRQTINGIDNEAA
jgi:hypothetical protein